MKRSSKVLLISGAAIAALAGAAMFLHSPALHRHLAALHGGGGLHGHAGIHASGPAAGRAHQVGGRTARGDARMAVQSAASVQGSEVPVQRGRVKERGGPGKRGDGGAADQKDLAAAFHVARLVGYARQPILHSAGAMSIIFYSEC